MNPLVEFDVHMKRAFIERRISAEQAHAAVVLQSNSANVNVASLFTLELVRHLNDIKNETALVLYINSAAALNGLRAPKRRVCV